MSACTVHVTWNCFINKLMELKGSWNQNITKKIEGIQK